MPKYSEIESPEIRREISQTHFEDREKIDELARLEEYVNRAPAGGAGIMHYRILQGKYPSEFLAFLLKVSPERYQAELKRQADKKAADQLQAAQKAAEEETELQDWLDAGGLR